MTTYSTGNPVGSPDPRDLYDNAENLDNAANSDDATWTDRLGQSRRTMAGIEQDATTAIQNAGYVGTGTDNAVEDYAAGIEITQYNQIVRDDGEFWRASGSETLPYTLTGAGVPEGGALVSVGDAALRQELGTPAGARAVDGIVRGNDGETYKMSAVVVRRDESESLDWQPIINSTHTPLNYRGLSSGSSNLTIQHGQGPVGTVLAVTDETYALEGMTMGCSGGGGDSVISFGGPCCFEVDLNDNSIRINEGLFKLSRFDAQVTPNGEIILSHPSSYDKFCPSISWTSDGLSKIPLTVHHLRGDKNSGETRFFLASPARGRVRYENDEWEIVDSPWGSADVSFSWDAAREELTVTHPTILGDDRAVIVTPGTSSTAAFNITGHSSTTSSFKVRFARFDGNTVTPGQFTNFWFDRGMTIQKNPYGKIVCDVGRVQVAASQINLPSGNLWFLSVNKDNDG